MRRRRLLLTLLVAVGLSACGQQSTPTDTVATEEPPAPSCKLTVGWDPWEPYQYADTDGRMKGLDIEIAELVAGSAGCTLSYVRGEWGGLLKGLREGTVDMLLAGTVLPDREEFAWFTQPYRDETFAVFVRGDELESLRGLSVRELAQSGKKIGITDGYFYGEEVNKLAYESAHSTSFIPAPFVELNYWRLIDGTTSALLDDPFVGASVIRRKGWENRIVRHPQVLSSGTVSLMFSRQSVNSQTVERLDAAVARHIEDGSIMKIIERYQG